MTIGETIQRLRTKRRLSQEQLAERLRVPRQAVSRWESDTAYPETDKIVRMSRLLGVSCDWELNDALPDTDKLVPLARSLGVSVDELLGNVSENGVSATPSPERPPDSPTGLPPTGIGWGWFSWLLGSIS